jgi:stage V sporulation protein S
MEQKTISRVKSDTSASKLAGYIAHVFERGDGAHELQCIGPASIGEGVKAVAAAKGMLAPKGIRIVIDPSFYKTVTEKRSEDDNCDKTGVSLLVVRI